MNQWFVPLDPAPDVDLVREWTFTVTNSDIQVVRIVSPMPTEQGKVACCLRLDFWEYERFMKASDDSFAT